MHFLNYQIFFENIFIFLSYYAICMRNMLFIYTFAHHNTYQYACKQKCTHPL
jgi:hypothetical protein